MNKEKVNEMLMMVCLVLAFIGVIALIGGAILLATSIEGAILIDREKTRHFIETNISKVPITQELIDKCVEIVETQTYFEVNGNTRKCYRKLLR